MTIFVDDNEDELTRFAEHNLAAGDWDIPRPSGWLETFLPVAAKLFSTPGKALKHFSRDRHEE